MAYFAAFTELFSDRLPGKIRYVFIGVMLLYATYRSFRVIRSFRQSKQKNQ